VLEGGGGTADASDGIAAALAAEFSVISYDRRGLVRSPLDHPKQNIGIEQHADDAVRLLDTLGIAEAFVFGSGLGALIGLGLFSREPGRVKLLVAHEPPTPELLSERSGAGLRALREEVLSLALRQGPRAAVRRVLAGMGVDREDREEDCVPPDSSDEQSRDIALLLSGDARAMDSYRLDLEALQGHARRIVPAFGGSSRAFYPAECALALAQLLGREAVEFPGSHNGYVLRPRAFAERLRALLQGEGREPLSRSQANGDDEAASVPASG
jgi:pimeloyl-ACP methyl ester carboxylesterase